MATEPACTRDDPCLLVDANLVVLLVVGSWDRTWIRKHKRTESFNADDFDLLRELVAGYARAVTTPVVLAEVSNLAMSGPRHVREALADGLARFVGRVPERSVASVDAVADPCFRRLGLTDAWLALLAKAGVHVATVDFDLYFELDKRGLTAINFNHFRDL